MTDKIRAEFEDCHLEMDLTREVTGEYFFEDTRDCYRSYLAGRKQGLEDAYAIYETAQELSHVKDGLRELLK